MDAAFLRYPTIIASVLAGLVAFSCAPKAKTQESPSKKPATTKPGDEPIDEPGVDPNKDPKTTSKYAFTKNSVVDLSVVDNNSTTKSLRSIAQGKKITVFQFSGVTCAECQITGPEVRAGINKLGSDAQVVVLFPNKLSAYQTSDYKGFVDSYSKGSRFAVDKDMAVLTNIRSSKDQFFGLYIIVKQDGTTHILNKIKNEPSTVLEAVKAGLQ